MHSLYIIRGKGSWFNKGKSLTIILYGALFRKKDGPGLCGFHFSSFYPIRAKALTFLKKAAIQQLSLSLKTHFPKTPAFVL